MAVTPPDEGTQGALLPGDTEDGKVPLSSWYALFLLTLTLFFAYMDRVAISILVEPIKKDLGLSDGQFGLLSGLAFAALFSTLGIPLARLADRGIRVKLIAVCLALWSLMTFVSGLARNFADLFLARVGVGIGEAGNVPASHSLIGALFPRNRRALAVTIFQTGTALGVSGGLVIVGVLGEKLGWRHTLQVIGLVGVPLALLIAFTLPEPARRVTQTARQENVFAALGGLMRDAPFVHVIFGISISSLCTFGITQWLPAFIMRSFSMGMAEVGAWVGLASAVSGIGGLVLGGIAATWLAPRNRRWELWLPALGFLLATPVYVVMFLSQQAWLVVVLKTAANFIASIGTGVAFASIQTLVSANRRATAISVIMFFSSLLGMGLGPALIGYISDAFSPTMGAESLRYALLASTVLPFWAAIHFYLASRGMKTTARDAAALPA